tara:strand:- start:3435 stop:4331 length:897 start_codon:yes stop_codon:yes gene_type:complete
MAFVTAALIGGGVAVAGGIAKLGMSLSGRKARREEQRAAKAELQKRMSQYEALDTSNLAANVQNTFTKMENTMEDLTVNQQQAQFEAQQVAQQQANIMQDLSGAAGGSGIAALAQTLANQGQLAAQRASASIGQQEAANQRAAAAQAGQIQMAERKGEQFAQTQRLAGAEKSRGLEYQKTGTLLGMSQQRTAAANKATAEARAQQMGAVGGIATAATQMAGSYMQATSKVKAAEAMGKYKPGSELADDLTDDSTTFGTGAFGGSGYGFGGDPNPVSGNLTFNPFTNKFEELKPKFSKR